jgi:transcriptional regulator with XRE-family HTH domain
MAKPKPPGGRRLKSKEPNPVDLHVGDRIRLRRMLMGMSQQELGKALGLSFQQMQKYERGVNRVAASRLHDLSRVLDVPLSFFFDDIKPATVDTASGSREAMAAGDALDPVPRETLELVREYYRIGPQIRHRLLELMKAIANASVESVNRSTAC